MWSLFAHVVPLATPKKADEIRRPFFGAHVNVAGRPACGRAAVVSGPIPSGFVTACGDCLQRSV